MNTDTTMIRKTAQTTRGSREYGLCFRRAVRSGLATISPATTANGAKMTKMKGFTMGA